MSIVKITDDTLAELSCIACDCDGKHGAYVLNFSVVEYSPYELWMLAGMLAGRECMWAARYVANIAAEKQKTGIAPPSLQILPRKTPPLYKGR